MTEDETIFCDNCSQECADPTGDSDIAVFCCKCVWQQERWWTPGQGSRKFCRFCEQGDDPIMPDGLRRNDPRDNDDPGIPREGS